MTPVQMHQWVLIGLMVILVFLKKQEINFNGGTTMEDMEELLQEALSGIITCRNCDNPIEPDCDVCSCGWKNPIVSMGLI